MAKRSTAIKLNAIDLFSGCGGLSQGMHDAGFQTKVAIELEPIAARAYKLNHPNTHVIQKDIRDIGAKEIKKLLGNEPLHLLAGCPPCQGFSSVRRLNKKQNVKDDRNNLVLEYFRMVEILKPITIMMENVPALKDYYLFKEIVKKLKLLGYHIEIEILDVKEYGVPQRRRRLVMLGSLLGAIAMPTPETKKITVRDAIFSLLPPELATDPLQKIVAKHTEGVTRRIKLTPKNGGSWKDLPKEYVLNCHKKDGVGFNDVYGRLRWDDYSTTITGGCLNPSKGRFLHPEQNRVITPREAALLQSFPKTYKFPIDIPKHSLALLIGNALPPKFSYFQSKNIASHIKSYQLHSQ
ncbi:MULTISPECIES: DNA cytosine methyltransferase [unclassified Polynucleobacter]|uniref:DNA cytosine methyltransferase n=1 Tax=unclassified Polynucleobacter TaxID=2640945 RepID=UPI001C0E7FE3|nr:MULTISPECIES: DNA cytosine methyltransferase [unclassified Polynucleobacter]